MRLKPRLRHCRGRVGERGAPLARCAGRVSGMTKSKKAVGGNAHRKVEGRVLWW